MTSEKHIQNITAIQQNMKQLQGLQMLQNLANTEQRGPMPPQGQEMMMMMDLAHHNQSLFLQMLAARQGGAPNQAMEQLMMAAGGEVGEQQEQGNMADPNPTKLFNCVICREFNTDIMDALASHIAVDRSMEGEGEVAMLLGNTHICKLCSYKTNLKANFQLHCKTDKHLARLSLYNHIREGGPSNEWKLGMLAGTNPTQIRCHACDFNTNSLHKLQSHVHTQGHEVSVILFTHLIQAEDAAGPGVRESLGLSYACSLCRFTARGKAALMQHARSLTHLRAEQVASASGEQPGIADIFTVTETSDTEQAESSETGEDFIMTLDDQSTGRTGMRYNVQFGVRHLQRTPRMFRMQIIRGQCPSYCTTSPHPPAAFSKHKYDDNLQIANTIHLQTWRFRNHFNCCLLPIQSECS